MDISINQRLKKFVKSKEIDPPSVYKNVGVTRGTWSGWINSNKPISVEKLVLIIKELDNINVRWLFTGEGNMVEESFKYNQASEGREKYKNGYCNLCEEKNERINDLNERIRDLKDHIITLKSDYKKETGDEDSAQYGQAANE